MTAVYVLRHPQSTWNVEQRYQGRLETPLTPEGRRQARLVSAAFGPGDLDAVISSPLGRARYLADQLGIVAEAPVLIDHRLTEIGLGAWEGLYRHQIEERYRSMYDAWYVRPDTVRFPQGEDLASVRTRALSALADIFVRYPTGNVALVSHHSVVQVIIATALSLDLRNIHRIRVSNAGITTLCGQSIPGSILTMNATEALYRTPVASAHALDCVNWKPRRIAS